MKEKMNIKGVYKMEDMKVFIIRYHNNGYFCRSVVLAESYEEAERILLKNFKEFDVTIEIEEYEEVVDKGIALTDCNKL
jgi:hypothetical protein